MSILYFDCGMGAAGDMLSAAVLELLDDKENFLSEMNHAGIPHVSFSMEPSRKCGITGTHLQVLVDDTEEDEHFHDYHHSDHDHNHGHHHHDHHHSSMEEITHLISHLHVSDGVKKDVMAVYSLIVDAESHVHGVPVTEIHFHEVGTMDALADITAFCLLMEKLGRPQVLASPIHVGSGTVRCAHGILPVPAPATAHLLQGIPMYAGSIQGELCTPTGAALLKHFVSSFGQMPVMTVSCIGYGMGKKDFACANCVRAMLGHQSGNSGDVICLSCNLDDMTAEALGFAMDVMLENGALDVWTQAIGMKKNRPGVMLSVLCAPRQKAEMVKLIFKHTTTLGIRETEHSRYCLTRTLETMDTPYGPVRVKHSEGYGISRTKAEYDDLASIARENNKSLEEIKNSLV